MDKLKINNFFTKESKTKIKNQKNKDRSWNINNKKDKSVILRRGKRKEKKSQLMTNYHTFTDTRHTVKKRIREHYTVEVNFMPNRGTDRVQSALTTFNLINN
jgi:hypothetical protein